MPKRRSKGEGSVYQDKHGQWWAALTLPPTLDGRRRTRRARARTKTEATRRLQEMRLEAARGQSTGGALTLSAWLDQWLDHHVATTCKPRAAEAYRVDVARIKPTLGRVQLQRLTPDNVRQWLVSMDRAGLSTGSIRKAHACLRAALNVAMREERVVRNVAALVIPPRAVRKAPEYLDEAGLTQFVQANADDPLLARWLVGFITGARQGEVLGLELARADLAAGELVFSRALQRLTPTHGCGGICGRGRASDCPAPVWPIQDWLDAEQIAGGLWLVPPKTESSVRRAPIPPYLVGALADHVQQAAPVRFVFESAPGVPIDPRRDHEAWEAALARAGLPDLPLHSMRHSAATLMRARGVDEATRRELMGHSTAVAHAIYAHGNEAAQMAALGAVAEIAQSALAD